jgi:hypothetical protein
LFFRISTGVVFLLFKFLRAAALLFEVSVRVVVAVVARFGALRVSLARPLAG